MIERLISGCFKHLAKVEEIGMSYPRFCSMNRKKLSWLHCGVVLGIGVAITNGLPAMTSQTYTQAPQLSQAQPQQWRRMTSEEQDDAWGYILNSPMGIAALNQLAIERFINPNCPKTFYLNEKVGGVQSLLRVKCPNDRGVSGAVGYSEMRVIFNRFESNIESFEVERVYSEGRPPATKLPD